MEIKKFQLDQESIDQLLRINASIEHQSIQYMRAQLQLDEMKTGVKGLYTARQQLINRVAAAKDINPNLIQDIHVDESGAVIVKLQVLGEPTLVPTESSAS